MIEGRAAEVVYLVEHPPTLTLGRRGTRGDILWTDAQLAEAGLAVSETPRGGEVTLHAPGQLVVYPILRIGRAIRAHLVALGEATARWCEHEGLEGCAFRMDVPGVWRGDRKLASIGVHVSRGVTVQGLSINIAPEPRLFGALVSCGMPDVEMTSVVRELRESGAGEAAEALARAPLAEVAARWLPFYAAQIDRELAWRV
jgi:lipoate-protein ligase B